MALPISSLGWMAGIVDLKGRICYKNNKTRHTKQIVLIVETKVLPIVRGLSEMTGTRPELMVEQVRPDWMRRGCTEHCPDAHVHQSGQESMYMPQCARWTITGAGMAVVLSTLIPYLTVDRGWDQAVEDATNQITLNGQGSGMVKASLRRLQEIGWQLPIMFAQAIVDDEEDDDGEGE